MRILSTYTFDEVKARKPVKIACIGCGKILKRVIDACQTINPYNLNSKGTPKSASEIRAELPGMLDNNEKFQRKTAKCKACSSVR